MHIEDWISRAAEHYERGELAEASDACRRVLASDPENVYALFQLGLVELDRQQYVEAKTHLRAALAQWDDLPEVYTCLGVALRHTGDLEEADDMFGRAITLAPDYAEAYYQRAKLRADTGDLATAVEQCRHALSLSPESVAWQVDLAALLRAQHDYEHALDVIRTCVRARPDDARAQCELGRCLLAAGQTEEAESAFTTATRLDRGCVAALENLADLWSAKHDWRAVRARNDLYETLLQQRKTREALARASQRLESTEHKTCELAAQVVAYLQLGEVDSASELLRYEELVSEFSIQTPPGYASLEAFNAELASYVVERSSFQTAPLADQHLVYRQSQELLQYDDPPIVALKSAIKTAVESYRERMVNTGANFPPGPVGDYWLQGWAVVMDGQGYKESHCHPPSWISGVYYVSVPSVVADAKAEHAGWLELGQPPSKRFGLRHEVPVMNFQPQPGRLVIFPSYMYHRTLPFESSERRISFAFNAIPSTSQGVGGFFAKRR